MNNNYKRWDGAPPMNSSEQASRNGVFGCGGFDNPFSATYRNPLDNPYSFESLKLRNKITFAIKHSPEFKRIQSILSQSGAYPSAASTFQLGGHQPKDMRDSLTRARDAMKDKFKPSYLQTPAVAVQSSPTLYEAFKTMNGVVDFVVLKAELAARSIKLNPIKILGKVGRFTGGLGLLFSALEAYNDRTLENFIITALGGGIYVIGMLVGVGVLTAPIWGTIATAGAIVLFTYQVGKVLYVAIKEMN